MWAKLTTTPSDPTTPLLKAVCSYTTPPSTSNLERRVAIRVLGQTPMLRTSLTVMGFDPPLNPTLADHHHQQQQQDKRGPVVVGGVFYKSGHLQWDSSTQHPRHTAVCQGNAHLNLKLCVLSEGLGVLSDELGVLSEGPHLIGLNSDTITASSSAAVSRPRSTKTYTQPRMQRPGTEHGREQHSTAQRVEAEHSMSGTTLRSCVLHVQSGGWE